MRFVTRFIPILTTLTVAMAAGACSSEAALPSDPSESGTASAVVTVDSALGSGGVSRIEGPTFASFPLAEVGPPPWRVHIKLAGVTPTTILVGGPQP